MTNANKNYIFLHEKVPQQRVTLLQGGTRSGKTYAVLYYILYLCLKYRGLEIDICRTTYTSLVSTTWKDFEAILISCGIYERKNHNKSQKYYILNNNAISYYGADNSEKVHGRTRDILFLNEAQQFDAKVVQQLFPRTKHRIICDFNPALGAEHWLDEYILKYPPLVTTYKDNPFLTCAQIEDIESRKFNKYWWTVYGSGQRANVEGVIFENWTIDDFDENLEWIFGMDFGFSKDPTTLVKVAVDKKSKKLYVHEVFYDVGLTTQKIANLCKIYCKNRLIIADNSDPRLIFELKKEHFLNVKPAIKGQNSVLSGIMSMLDYKIIVTIESKNILKELRNYRWHDKRANIPIDDWNHAIDAIRYALTYYLDTKNIVVYAS
ncbi:MAG: PBSX family phage terminase large subunit [Thermoplasmata archaeon]